jgi:phage terminase small subunit
MSSARKTPPMGLGPAGKALWKSVHDDLPDGWDLDHRELELLSLAARQADDLARLEKAIEKEGTMSTGSTGQPTLHPAIPEARQARQSIGRLLGALQLPDEDDQPATAASHRGRAAARARWGRREHLERMRNGAA